jgi:hypothetical protein
MEMTFRRRSRARRWLGWLEELPPWQRAAVVAVPAGLVAVTLVARRRMWQGVALVASAVEEVADTVEDAAESVRDAARERATA